MLRFPVVTGRLAPYRFYLEPKAGGIGDKPVGGCGVRHHVGLRDGARYVVGYPAAARAKGAQAGFSRLKPRFAGEPVSLIDRTTFVLPP